MLLRTCSPRGATSHLACQVPPVVPSCRTPFSKGQLKSGSSCSAATQNVPQQDTTPLLMAQNQYASGFKGRIAPSDEKRLNSFLNGISSGSLDGSSGIDSDSRAQRRRRRATVDVKKLLTNRITAATTLEELHNIVAAHGSSLDHIHVSKLLSRAAQISTTLAKHTGANAALQHQHMAHLDQQQQVDLQHQALLSSTLGQMMQQRLRHATADSLVASLASLARLAALQGSNSSSSSSAAHFAAKALELLPNMSMSQITVIMWALAKLGFKPSSSWVQPMLEAFMQQYNTQQQQQQQHTPKHNSLRMQAKQLPALQQRPVLLHLQQQQQPKLVTHSKLTDASLLMYALAVMDCQPGAAWFSSWQAVVLQQLPHSDAQDLSQLLWGVARLKLSPEPSWLRRVSAAFEPLMPSASRQALTTTLWALARLHHPPGDSWCESFLDALQNDDLAIAAQPQTLSTCLASLARLKLPVSPRKIGTLLSRSAAHLESFSTWQLTDVIWACASLTIRPDAAWTKTFLLVTAKLADSGKFTVNQLTSVLWSLAVLRDTKIELPMSQQLQIQVLLQALAAASGGRGLQQLGAGGRSGLAWSLAAMGVSPSKPWLSSYLTAAFAGGLAEDQLRCANVLFCVASLDFDYLFEWLGEFLAGQVGGSGDLVDLGLEKYAALAGVLQALGDMDDKQLRAAWLELSNSNWSVEGAGAEQSSASSVYSTPLPPGLASWVDSLLDSAGQAVKGA